MSNLSTSKSVSLRAHEGSVAILGPPIPRNPWRWIFLAGKAAGASLVALIVDHLSGNPDHVTSTFVAILCVSPVVLIGMRRALDQVVGSMLGGIAGTLMMVFELNILIGIPIAVGLAVLACCALRFKNGYPVAAFSALFVQAVPRGDPVMTLGVRLLAVATGALAAFIVNLLVSSAAYRNIFRRRISFAERTVSSLLLEAATSGPLVVRSGFPMLAELAGELDRAREELRWRGSDETRQWIASQAERVATLRRLLHLVLDLAYRLDEESLQPDALRDWLLWLTRKGEDEPPVPASLISATRRIRDLGSILRS